MNHYNCKICNKKHSYYYGLDTPVPDSINDIPEEERGSRVQFFEDKYILDREKLLVKGEIEIQVERSKNKPIVLRVWISIDIEEFKKAINGGDRISVLEIEGEIDNEIPLYEDLRGTNAVVIMDPSNEYPSIKVKTESRIKEDQFEPISTERMIELMNRFHHPELFRDKIDFDKNFESRFQQTLEEVEKKFFKRRKRFVINLSSPRTLLFQIIASKMLVNPSGKSNGYGIHLAFDDTDIETKEELEKFERSPFVDGFDCVEIDDIITYQKDINRDKEKLQQIVTDLISKFYREDVEETEIDFFGL